MINSELIFINEKFLEFEREIKNNKENRRSLGKENSYLTKRREKWMQY